MRKSSTAYFLLAIFFLSACNLTSHHDKANIASKSLADANTKTGTQGQNINTHIGKNPRLSITTSSGKNKLAGKEIDTWRRIAAGLRLKRDISKKTTADKLAWYVRNQAYLDRVSERASPYLYYIVEELEKRDMPLDIALLPVVESAYYPFAYSPSHASGIWQFIPATGKNYGLKQNWWYDGRRDIIAATDAALNYLQKLHKEFNDDWLLALAAYNYGEGNVARAIKRNKKAGKAIDFFSLRLPRETRGYVPSLLAAAEIVSDPSKYKITLKPIANTQYFEIIDTKSQIDLAIAAELAELSIEELYTLNSGFNRWATHPKGPHRLLIPVNKASAFENKLASISPNDRINWQQHKIKKGESLSLIAARYKTSIATLKQINRLKSNTIHAGHPLLIPTAQKPLKYYSLSLDARRYKGLKYTGDGTRYIYTTKRGDSLWDIGQHYGVSVKELCAWNAISSKSILLPGKKLEVWIDGETNKIAKKTLLSSIKTDTDNAQHVSYQVLQGDSLWLISKRFGVSIRQIKEWNSLAEKRYIKPGQLLNIYTGTSPKGA